MSYFTNLIYDNGILAMFFIILIEYACFPISSEIVLPFSGAIASVQNINFFTILPASVIAGLIGTSFCYFVGLFGGNKLIESIKVKFPKTENGINSSYLKFQKHGIYAVCFARLIPICRTYIAFIAGSYKQRYLNFLISSAVGITIWNTILIGLGYFLRENWNRVGTYYSEYKAFSVPVLLIVLLFVVSLKLRKFRKC